MDKQNKTSLVDFLMFDKQAYPKQAKDLLKIVDEFFAAVKEKNNGLVIPTKEYNYLRDMSVVFYSSRLFITNPGLSLSIIAILNFFKEVLNMKIMKTLFIIACFIISGIGYSMASSSDAERHDVLYTCDCGQECKCNSMSTKPGDCSCDKPMKWGDLLKVEGTEAILCQCGEG